MLFLLHHFKIFFIQFGQNTFIMYINTSSGDSDVRTTETGKSSERDAGIDKTVVFFFPWASLSSGHSESTEKLSWF